MDMFPGIIIIVVSCVLGWYVLKLILSLIGYGILGAGQIFSYANEQGFIGLAVCLACFVFMFPIMAVISIVLGYLSARVICKQESSESTIDQTHSEDLEIEKAIISKIEHRKHLGLDIEAQEKELNELRKTSRCN